ncbi:MAG TPA: methyltransferase domain-containing protein [Smithellaceae bacterium]|jgi:SAM-dependent methyltransferase|nr:methyltransferase domain-containing protein [Bacillota bacterium]HQC10189.1 methyltransferase domain-containing protein [Smithellaceae bacterium]
MNKKNCRKLNLGSGNVLKPDFINFDCVEIERGGQKTDVIGRIEDVLSIFGPKRFDFILCSHVIEHFYRSDAAKVLADCLELLKPSGTLLVEAPDISKVLDLYYNKKIGLEYVIECMYGIEAHRLKWGDWGVHRSGWTGKLLAEEMKRIGFVDVVVGDGTTHRHPERDLRVTGKRG